MEIHMEDPRIEYEYKSFKIDVIVWKYEVPKAIHHHPQARFKIDVIVWKSSLGFEGPGRGILCFKIDVIVWKYG